MTMGPEPIRRIFLRSVRFGTRHYPLYLAGADQEDLLEVSALRHAWSFLIQPSPRRYRRLRLLRSVSARKSFDLAVDDGGFGNRLLALVEHVVDAPRAEPHRLAVAPELLPEHAHALFHAFLDGVGLQRQLALAGEGGPLGLLAGLLGLPVRDQVFRH